MGFKALVLDKDGDDVAAAVKSLDESALPEGEVSVDVAYSDVNYKDGLIVRNKAPLVRAYPHVPGIDFSGTVAEAGGGFAAGDEVVATGWGIGERQWGGFAQKARIKAAHLVRLPGGLSLRQAMALGTAGFTAMLCVMALEDHDTPKQGPVLVTGAGGGVGSVAVALLASLGYAVTAVTGREETKDYLRGLGAAEVVGRDILAPSGKPMDSSTWAGCVDTVGGEILATVITQMNYGATIAACGNAAGAGLKTTVLPFILRSVKLVGCDSVNCPQPRRQQAWDRLAADLPLDKLDAMTTVRPLADVPAVADLILAGQVRGRTVIDVNA
jgi:acrylyl-CoA reductase (NADPH)